MKQSRQVVPLLLEDSRLALSPYSAALPSNASLKGGFMALEEFAGFTASFATAAEKGPHVQAS